VEILHLPGALFCETAPAAGCHVKAKFVERGADPSGWVFGFVVGVSKVPEKETFAFSLPLCVVI